MRSICLAILLAFTTSAAWAQAAPAPAAAPKPIEPPGWNICAPLLDFKGKPIEDDSVTDEDGKPCATNKDCPAISVGKIAAQMLEAPPPQDPQHPGADNKVLQRGLLARSIEIKMLTKGDCTLGLNSSDKAFLVEVAKVMLRSPLIATAFILSFSPDEKP